MVDAHVRHQVWFSDAVTMAENQIAAVGPERWAIQTYSSVGSMG